MRSVLEQNSTGAELPFKFVGGDVSLDLINTVDWTEDGPVHERITDYRRFVEWAKGAGIISVSDEKSLLRLAKSHPEAAAKAYAKVIELRSFLQRLFRSVADGQRSEILFEEFNKRLVDVLSRLRIAPAKGRGGGGKVADWSWSGFDEHLDSVLWQVIRSAAELLTSDESARIRSCDGPDCGWMYVDRSRNHLRRWCEMETCGTAAKTRRRRERTRRVTRRATGAAKRSR